MFVLIIIMGLNLVVGCVFLIYSGKITTTISNKLQGTYVTKYYDDSTIRTIFDSLQSEVNYN
jgi:hypothetical protein